MVSSHTGRLDLGRGRTPSPTGIPPLPPPIRRRFPDGMQGGINVDLNLRQSVSGLGPRVGWECVIRAGWGLWLRGSVEGQRK